MTIEIERHGKWETIWATKAKVMSMPFGTLLEIDKVNYPIFPGQRFFIRDDDEKSMIPAENNKPKPKYKQGKLGL